MIQPEVDKDLFKLVIGVDRSIELVFDQFRIDELLRLVGSHGFPPEYRHCREHLRAGSTEDLPALLRVQGIEDGNFFLIGTCTRDSHLILSQ